jgi:RimJ/RimL family protein N-acetyltransferase
MLSFRKATIDDILVYFEWTNDPIVREQSYNSSIIDFESHKKWFESKLKDDSCLMLVFQNEEKENVGQIRIQKQTNQESLIGISIASEFRGRGCAKEMLQMATDFFLAANPNYHINAFIKEKNLSSKFSFEKAGFEFNTIINYEDVSSFHYIKKQK